MYQIVNKGKASYFDTLDAANKVAGEVFASTGVVLGIEQVKLEATFDPQVWVNDNAMSVDPEGDTTWDCTAFVEAEGLTAEVWKKIDGKRSNWWLDKDDRLVDDPAAPEWIKDWARRHPFTITVQIA